MRCALILFASSVSLLPAGCGRELTRLPREVYLDKCKGAWAGQMIGVAYGAPYEFEYCGEIMEDPIRPWRPEYIRNGLSQDDLYVEIIWLRALQRHGFGITGVQAGQAFAETAHGLCHANLAGRSNVRDGIMPPWSGHPSYNQHADDIDFQIESDIFGILCPGMPVSSNALCDVFGHITNYGDGVYGGMFVAGMYAAAYLEDEDVERVIHAGLACIPPESSYRQCITDVICWYHEEPGDWRRTWHRIEERWQDDEDCVPEHPFNIDAKLNGAYIAMGLLYGRGDLARTLEVSTRCGQDNDCNPSNAAGVLGCMKGFSGLPSDFTAGFDGIADEPFAGDTLTPAMVIEACQKLTERLVLRRGGRITEDDYHVPVETPEAAPLEQWRDQADILRIAIPRREVERWDPRWRVLSCGYEMGPGYIPEFAGRHKVLLIVPRRTGPAVIQGGLAVPDREQVTMRIPVSSFGSDGDWIGDFRLKVFINDGDEPVLDKVIRTLGRFEIEAIDVTGHAGDMVTVRVEAHQEGDYHWERAYLGRVEFTNEID